MPPGVFSIVTGDAEDAPLIGGEMTSNPIVRKLSFTGSTEVGKLLMAQCSATIKKVSLELGGNAPFLVFDDADLDEVIAAMNVAKFRNAGQTCISANRVLVQAGIHDAFAARLAEKVAALKVGPGTAEGVRIGPLAEARVQFFVPEPDPLIETETGGREGVAVDRDGVVYVTRTGNGALFRYTRK